MQEWETKWREGERDIGPLVFRVKLSAFLLKQGFRGKVGGKAGDISASVISLPHLELCWSQSGVGGSFTDSMNCPKGQ